MYHSVCIYVLCLVIQGPVRKKDFKDFYVGSLLLLLGIRKHAQVIQQRQARLNLVSERTDYPHC